LRSQTVAALFVALLSLLTALPASALTLAEEVRMGKQVVAQLRPFELAEDRSLTAIGKRLSAVMQRKDLPWRFWVVEEVPDYNAFAAPGGFVFITRPYYQKLNDNEAAFVLGHEMAHVDLHHYEKQVSRETKANIGNLILRVLTNDAGVWGTAADVGATAYVTHYSRVLEREADFAGYRYAERAGYDARAAVSALSKLGKESRLHSWIANIYATHPLLSSREDQLAALGGREPEDTEPLPPSPEHKRDLTAGLQPFDPSKAIAVRILGEDGKRWEDRWRKSFTRRLHLRLLPLGFRIAGDDLMYKPDVGDPVAAARSRNAEYLLLITVHKMTSAAGGPEGLAGTPVRGAIDVSASLVEVGTGKPVGREIRFSREREGVDVLPADPDVLYTDTVIGRLADRAAGRIAIACARALGAKPAPPPAEAADAPPTKPSAGPR
jgi:Zn-dependent protease with chaperone function